MNFFLRAKHWQLFILMFAVPFILEIIFMVYVFSSIMTNGSEQIALSKFGIFFPIVMVLMMALFFGWFYAVGISLFKKLPPDAKVNLTLFKVCVVFPALYAAAFSIVVSQLFTSIAANPAEPPFNLVEFAAVFPLHLFAMFCIFYCDYFIAKCLKAVEWQRRVVFSDFVVEFFLMWFFFVGIWLLQPRINKIFADEGAE